MNYKIKRIGLTAIFIFGFILLTVILVFSFVDGKPKTPATGQQVSSILSDMGYSPIDVTDSYEKQDLHLNGVITFETKKIHFEFFDFDNNGSADNAYSVACSQIREHRSQDCMEGTEGYANYYMKDLRSSTMYYITIRVENTTIYAYCDREYTSELYRILTAIGYSE